MINNDINPAHVHEHKTVETVFYFCPDEATYNTLWNQNEISSRTIAFVISDRSIRRNGIKYGTMDDEMFASMLLRILRDHPEFLPIATTNTVGVISIGQFLKIDPNTGSTSVDIDAILNDPTFITKLNNFFKENPYVLPIATDKKIGAIRIGQGLKIDPETGIVDVDFSSFKDGQDGKDGKDAVAELIEELFALYVDSLRATYDKFGVVKIAQNQGINVVTSGANTGTISTPVAASDVRGTVKVGDYLTMNNETLNVDYTGLKEALGTDNTFTPYDLPIASSSTLGGVKIGNGLTMTGEHNEVLNVNSSYVLLLLDTETMQRATNEKYGVVKIAVNGGILVDNGVISIDTTYVKGEKGDKGDKGDTGDKGDKGDPGTIDQNDPIISEINTNITNITNAITQILDWQSNYAITTLNNSVNNFITLLNSVEWNLVFHESYWDETINAYLLTVGIVGLDDVGHYSRTYSQIIETINTIESTISTISAITDENGNLTGDLTALEARIALMVLQDASITKITNALINWPTDGPNVYSAVTNLEQRVSKTETGLEAVAQLSASVIYSDSYTISLLKLLADETHSATSLVSSFGTYDGYELEDGHDMFEKDENNHAIPYTGFIMVYVDKLGNEVDVTQRVKRTYLEKENDTWVEKDLKDEKGNQIYLLKAIKVYYTAASVGGDYRSTQDYIRESDIARDVNGELSWGFDSLHYNAWILVLKSGDPIAYHKKRKLTLIDTAGFLTEATLKYALASLFAEDVNTGSLALVTARIAGSNAITQLISSGINSQLGQTASAIAKVIASASIYEAVLMRKVNDDWQLLPYGATITEGMEVKEKTNSIGEIIWWLLQYDSKGKPISNSYRPSDEVTEGDTWKKVLKQGMSSGLVTTANLNETVATLASKDDLSGVQASIETCVKLDEHGVPTSKITLTADSVNFETDAINALSSKLSVKSLYAGSTLGKSIAIDEDGVEIRPNSNTTSIDFNTDGSGFVANGNISWDENGKVSIKDFSFPEIGNTLFIISNIESVDNIGELIHNNNANPTYNMEWSYVFMKNGIITYTYRTFVLGHTLVGLNSTENLILKAKSDNVLYKQFEQGSTVNVVNIHNNDYSNLAHHYFHYISNVDFGQFVNFCKRIPVNLYTLNMYNIITW